MDANHEIQSALEARPVEPGCAEEPDDPPRVRSCPPTQTQGSRSHAFRLTFFPEARASDWDDWRWQFAHRITTFEELGRVLHLSDAERAAASAGHSRLPLAVTPYYASLLDRDDPSQPLRRTVVPTGQEQLSAKGESIDPLAEQEHTLLPGLVQRYPDRVLFLVTHQCAVFCRYCTRSRMVGRSTELRPSRAAWQRALDHIRRHPEIRDVLLSGGDPLTLADRDLDWLLARLRAIPHVELIRIGTKLPMALPQRITPSLVETLQRYHPLWMSLHCTHPDELTPEAAAATSCLANAGIPLGSQTVLLKAINDDGATMKRLFHGLLRLRVRPYYLYQCDPIVGSAHFRTTIQQGIEIIQLLRGHTTGYAVPTYVVDAPGGGGKIPIQPDHVLGHGQEMVWLRNYRGQVFGYPECAADDTRASYRL